MSMPTFVKTKQTDLSSSAKKVLITGEELFAMGDIGPAELVKGEIIPKMPTGHTHGFIESLIAFFLTRFVREHNLGRVVTGEVGIYVEYDPDTVRAANIAFISHDQYDRVQSAGFLDVAPELVVEIMSPANTWSEVHEKLSEYFAIGVNIVWVVDPQLQQIHVFRALDDVSLLTKEGTLTSEDVLPGFALPLTELFNHD
ncbi:MAG TPA: Uma2 family endonuclease [Chromatiaceae bacterium]|nr:Uma2 family endonuclease [Chromatiaceae bacterium]